MNPSIATGYDRLAAHLQEFLCTYVPRGWVGPISEYSPTPLIATDEARLFMNLHRAQSLEAALISMSMERPLLKHFFVRGGISKFFEKKEFIAYESELQ